jgi:hypothetical protein
MNGPAVMRAFSFDVVVAIFHEKLHAMTLDSSSLRSSETHERSF